MQQLGQQSSGSSQERPVSLHLLSPDCLSCTGSRLHLTVLPLAVKLHGQPQRESWTDCWQIALLYCPLTVVSVCMLLCINLLSRALHQKQVTAELREAHQLELCHRSAYRARPGGSSLARGLVEVVTCKQVTSLATASPGTSSPAPLRQRIMFRSRKPGPAGRPSPAGVVVRRRPTVICLD